MSSTDTFDPLFGFHVHGTPHPLQCIGQPCTQTHALFPGPSAFVIGKNRCNWINIPSLPRIVYLGLIICLSILSIFLKTCACNSVTFHFWRTLSAGMD